MILNFDLYNFEKLLKEGLIKSYPAETVVKYIRKKYNLTDDDIDVDNDEFTTFILINKDIKDTNNKLFNNIEQVLKSSGYYYGKDEDVCLTFERKFDDNVFNDIKSSDDVKYLYHVSPSINDNKILSKGLIPKSKNYRFNYPDRIYLFTNNDNDFLQRMCYELYKEVNMSLLKKFFMKSKQRNEYFDRVKPNEYSVFRVDIKNIDNISLYRDPNSLNFESYYTHDNISIENIQKIQEIKV